MPTEAIKVVGLAEFQRNLKKLNADLPKALRVALNGAADVIVDSARPRVPRRSGRAAAALKARSTQTAARVSGGSARAPYYPWLDFGGEGRRRGRPAARPFIKQGRYLYAAYYEKRDSGEFEQILTKALLDVAAQAGVEVE
jgi:hypothetical protein